MSERIKIPSWFADGNMPSPCLCGKPLEQGEPYLIAEAEQGGQRWFHLLCWQMMMEMQEDDGDTDDFL
jgi:hypothetical protein